jgi:tetratricopeptide (TPR) repeat protein
VRPDFAEAHNDLGVALADKGQIDGAINEFLAGLRAKPNQAASHYNVAVLLASKGNNSAAIEHLEAALTLSPDYVDARRELDRLRGANANR